MYPSHSSENPRGPGAGPRVLHTNNCWRRILLSNKDLRAFSRAIVCNVQTSQPFAWKQLPLNFVLDCPHRRWIRCKKKSIHNYLTKKYYLTRKNLSLTITQTTSTQKTTNRIITTHHKSSTFQNDFNNQKNTPPYKTNSSSRIWTVIAG
jgi:hypothetical protein